VNEYYTLLVNLRIGSVIDYSCRDNVVVLFNDLKIPLRELLEIDPRALLLGWRYNDNGFWELGDIKIKHPSTTVIEVFNFRQYARLKHVEGIIVDIGAGVGDSVIYFILRGAKRVIALEPNVKYYYEMLENIKLNNIEENRVVALNKAANSQTLLELVSNYEITSGVLKIDCEGCEYTVLINTPIETLRHFREIIVEYHGTPQPLVKKLIDSGFKVVVEKPWTFIKDKELIPVGFIHAEIS